MFESLDKVEKMLMKSPTIEKIPLKVLHIDIAQYNLCRLPASDIHLQSNTRKLRIENRFYKICS